MKWFITVLSFVLLSLVGALSGAPQAKAISVYDSIVNNWGSKDMPMNWGGTKTPFEFGEAIVNLPMSTLGGCSASKEDIITMITGGNEYYLTVINGSSAYLVLDTSGVGFDQEWFISSGTNGQLRMNTSEFVALWWGAENTMYCTNTPTPLAKNYGGEQYRPVEVSFEIEYPADYAGQLVDSVAETSNFSPNFYVSVANKWKASIHDTNFNTFDGIPFTCSEDLAPVLHYEIWNKNVDPEVMIGSGFQSATAQIDFQFPENSISQDYRVVGWYDCGGPPEIQFTESNYFDFTINGTGQLHTLGLETCLIDGFPFFDLEACTVGLNSTLALLAFQSANPVNEGVLGVATTANPAGCHELGTLGEWINKEGETICPGFSSEVRGVVTPFITVTLAMMVFFFISRGRGVVI